MATIDVWLPKAYQLDEHALSEIYQALNPALYRYAYRLLGNAADAEDIVAETAKHTARLRRSTSNPDLWW
jgi:DNA-directed RNA polymerase specialized sigma24 family protein